MENKPKRGCFLTGWLWIGLIGSFFGMFTILTNSYMVKSIPEMVNMPLAQQILNTIVSIVFFVSIIGIMRWKKVYIYGYVAASLISFVSAFINNKFTVVVVASAVIGLILNLVVAYFIMKLFKEMETEEEQEI
ncbi:hypothetical protein CLOACE_14670 [Clostridium acetireducens DSM 10703]|jgi:hypothetical protein|uniref:Uncharacterized protein n=1 Tax=Clostridium acetireducens DSM 10703 TaxID=1121290 RepID=A0A1E8EY25_9CLOT|nr:hypothetical protein [Clostridium acetireducens]OFI05849.1 hypothetical protein CLOACE_14670 [Clostridium acetireducens DSM 10703]